MQCYTVQELTQLSVILLNVCLLGLIALLSYTVWQLSCSRGKPEKPKAKRKLKQKRKPKAKKRGRPKKK